MSRAAEGRGGGTGGEIILLGVSFSYIDVHRPNAVKM